MAPSCANGFSLKEPRYSLLIVDQYESASLMLGSIPGKVGKGLSSTRRQNSRSCATRFSGSLPAIKLAFMAPIEVPMIQSGSRPASCKASYTPAW